jgi:hypothetical protein
MGIPNGISIPTNDNFATHNPYYLDPAHLEG